MTPPLRTLSDWSPEAVVFDCDGTLMDTERHWQDARNRAFREFGLMPPRASPIAPKVCTTSTAAA